VIVRVLGCGLPLWDGALVVVVALSCTDDAVAEYGSLIWWRHDFAPNWIVNVVSDALSVGARYIEMMTKEWRQMVKRRTRAFATLLLSGT
jgi:hypothetical protein